MPTFLQKSRGIQKREIKLFRNFMNGRYGNDQLNLFILGLSLVFALVSMFTWGIINYIFSTLQLILLILWALRTFSRNTQKRRNENQIFLNIWSKYRNTKFSKGLDKLFKEISGFFNRLSDRQHKYFKCPVCHVRLRVPRGRGEITITCPKCKTKFDKKS